METSLSFRSTQHACSMLLETSRSTYILTLSTCLTASFRSQIINLPALDSPALQSGICPVRALRANTECTLSLQRTEQFFVCCMYSSLWEGFVETNCIVNVGPVRTLICLNQDAVSTAVACLRCRLCDLYVSVHSDEPMSLQMQKSVLILPLKFYRDKYQLQFLPCSPKIYTFLGYRHKRMTQVTTNAMPSLIQWYSISKMTVPWATTLRWYLTSFSRTASTIGLLPQRS